MRLDKPRVQPVDLDKLDDEQKAVMDKMFGTGVSTDAPNIFLTLANHPTLMKRWMVFANHVLFKSTLSARDREIVILRIGWLCQSGYEFAQHTRIGRQAGMSDEEIARVKEGASAAGWTPLEVLILKATDELHADAFISDATFAGLSEHYSEQQIMDLVFAVGNYNLVSMALNTLGVQLEPENKKDWKS